MNDKLYNELIALNNAISKHQDQANNFFFKYGNREDSLPRGFETDTDLRIRDLFKDIQRLLIAFSALYTEALKVVDIITEDNQGGEE